MDLQAIARGQATYPINSVQQDRALVQSLQLSLNKMGFSAGSADGIWGSQTGSAYRSFADYYGFRADELSPKAAYFIVSSVGVQVSTPTPTPAPPRPSPTPTPSRPAPTPTPAPQTGNIFSEGLRFSLRWEGGYVNNPSDYGGETNKGVTTATYQSYRRRKGLGAQSVRHITDAEVHEIYRDMYWKPAQCELMVRPLAIVHLDTAINFGVGGATEFLQETLGIGVDGSFGPATRNALSRGNTAATARRYCQARIDYRYRRVSQDPSQRVFLQGWLNRDNDLLRYISNMT